MLEAPVDKIICLFNLAISWINILLVMSDEEILNTLISHSAKLYNLSQKELT